ncbi:MAG TPA: hypothetical protein VMG41_17280 [Gemmatimonadales bacterium]|nr:hypothetical protein [Gemmatimonadales bacterium]
MRCAWESEGEECWNDREAWRGDRHQECAEAWRCDADEGFVWTGEEDASEPMALEDDWPEDLAGPEYWMFKDMEE